MRVFRAVSTLSSWVCMMVFMVPNGRGEAQKLVGIGPEDLVCGLVSISGLEPLDLFDSCPSALVFPAFSMNASLFFYYFYS